MKWVFITIITFCLCVTCFNVQAIRDQYCPTADPIEDFILTWIEGGFSA